MKFDYKISNFVWVFLTVFVVNIFQVNFFQNLVNVDSNKFYLEIYILYYNIDLIEYLLILDITYYFL